MPFIDSSQSVQSKLHLSNVNPGVLVGVCALVLFAVFTVGGNALALFQGDGGLVVRKGQESSSNQGSLRGEDISGSTSSSGGDDQHAVAELSASSNASGPAALEARELYVFVSGAVASPGVYALPQGSRVVDALEAAGGFAEGAASDAVNLARSLQDGEQVAIPTLEQVEKGMASIQVQGQETSPAPAAQEPQSGLININTASQDELCQLPGIGPATASKIVASREQEGAFATKEDLMRVSGIGEKKFASLQDLICT